MLLNQSIPEKYLNVVWKRFILLYPRYKEIWQFIDENNLEEFQDLSSVAKVLYGDSNILTVLKLKEDQLYFPREYIKNFITVFNSVYKNDSDTFWSILSIQKLKVSLKIF